MPGGLPISLADQLTQAGLSAGAAKIIDDAIPDNLSAGGSSGTGLTAEQVSAGADAVVGTNNGNELINKFGNREFVANIIPRLQTEATISTLVNGGGEIASTSDSHKIAKLYGTPGSGTVQWFHARGQNDSVEINGQYADFAGAFGGGFPNVSHQTVNIISDSILSGTYDTWTELTTSQKNDYVVKAGSATFGQRFSAIGEFYLNTSGPISYTLARKLLEWDAVNGWQPSSTYSVSALPSFSVIDEDFNVYFAAYTNTPGQGRASVIFGQVAEADLTIGAADSALGLFGATPIVRRTAANVGAGGSRVGTTGNTVTDGATFDGGLGGNAYTIGQIVRALKQYGLLA